MKKIRLTLRQARLLQLSRQLLDGVRLLSGKAGCRQVIGRLGYVQIDTISVIERSHHVVLYTRVPGYQPGHLDELLWPDRRIFEYWAHAASYIPMTDYRYYLPAIRRTPKPSSWYDKWTRHNQAVIKRVLRRIGREGPLSASDFPDDPRRKRGPWWDWKPEKAALEVLFWRGDLMIRQRRKFQRVYDLTERVLPPDLDLTVPDEKEEQEFFIRRALTGLGAAAVQDINHYIGVAGKLNDRLRAMVREGRVAEVSLEGSDRPYYILPEDLEIRSASRSSPDVIFLSPFDNSIILRDRNERIFGFSYFLECYTPPPKRKYGYFCLPILWQNDLVGRIDPKADRQEKRLIVQHLHLEKKGLDRDRFMPSLARALERFAAFHGCSDIRFAKPVPPKLVQDIKRHIP